MESEGLDPWDDVAEGGVDKDPYPTAPCGQVGRHLGHITWGLGLEDEPHEVDAQGLYGTDVVGLAHTANFDKHGDESLDGK